MALAAQARALLDGRTTTVAAYVSMGTEVETRPLLAMLLETGHRVLVPRLGAGLDIGWGEMRGLDALRDMTTRPSHIRPQEPDSPTLGPETLAAADLIIVPTLLVARDGTRLGRGGGWYDRALTHAKPGARIVAVCWPWEVIDGPLPYEAHDLPVDAALTPDGLVPLGQGHCRRER